MSWTEKTVHPRYQETAKTIQTYVWGTLDSCFQSQYGQAMEAALTPHQLGKMRQVGEDAATAAIKGYIRVCEDYRKFVDKRSRRGKTARQRKK